MIGEFYDVIDSLKDRNEIRFFFKSLLTAEEIAMFMRRIEIAVLLSVGYCYKKISGMLGVGFSKIANVQRALQQDDNGYKIIVSRLIKNRKERLRKMKRENKNSLVPTDSLNKKYPAHFLLSNMLDVAIEKLEEDAKELEKEAVLYTPSSKFLRK